MTITVAQPDTSTKKAAYWPSVIGSSASRLDDDCRAFRKELRVSYGENPELPKGSDRLYFTSQIVLDWQDALAHEVDDARFRALKTQWERERPRGADLHLICAHPAYQEVVSMGWSAVPPILREMKTGSALWFVALRKIVGDESPITPAQSGKVEAIRQAWLSWGKSRGYIGLD